MTLANWGPSLGSFCSQLCNTLWLCNLEEARFVEQMNYENGAEEITIASFQHQEDEVRLCSYLV